MALGEKDYKRTMIVYWKGQTSPSYFNFNDFEDLKSFKTDNRIIAGAEITARWPKDSAIPDHPARYTEIKDARKLLKKLGVLKRLPKIKLDSGADSESQEKQDEAKAEVPKVNGIYLLESKTRALVVSNGANFVMPVYQDGIIFGSTSSDQVYQGRVSSHRIVRDKTVAMISLEELADQAEKADADLITFTPTYKQQKQFVGLYTFFKLSSKSTFAGADFSALKDRLKAQASQ